MLTKRDFGFLHMLGTIRVRSLLWPEGACAVALGAFASWGLVSWVSAETRLNLAGDYLVMAGVLLGVVFATLAVVVSLLSDSYLLFLHDSEGGILPFMAPFVVGVGVQSLALVAALAYRVLASTSASLEPLAFMAATILFLYALIDVISLAKTVVAHAATRAEYLAAVRSSRQEGEHG
jgi:hypothetical protein